MAKSKLSNPTSLVTLKAGEGETAKDFLVHKDFASHYFPVLKAAFNSDFIERQSQIYNLSEVSPDAVQLLVEWFYNQTLELPVSSGDQDDGNESMKLVQLWVLADKFLLPSLQNLVVRKLEWLRAELDVTATDCLDYVYQNTGKGSPLRLLFVHQCACHIVFPWYSDYPDQFPKEMLLELVNFMGQIVLDPMANSGLGNHWCQYEIPEYS